MEAVILAGGFGTRLRPVIADRPKPMAPVCGRPFLELLLHRLIEKGFDRFILSVGYMAHVIYSHFGDSFAGTPIIYEIETTPLGTGGALRAALRHSTDELVFVFNGDTYFDLDPTDVMSCWSRRRNPIIVAKHVDDVSRYGSLVVVGTCLRAFSEKGGVGPGLINGGCYLVPANLLSSTTLQPPYSFEADFLPAYLQTNSIDVVSTSGLFIDIGVPDDYLRAQQLFCG